MVNFVEANAAKWDGIIPDNMVDTEDMLGMVYCEMLGYEAPFGYLKAIEVMTLRPPQP